DSRPPTAGSLLEEGGTPGWAVVSPGISSAHPRLQELARRSVPMLDELDLASRFLPGPLVAVTGTNGKSTTVALVALMLRAGGYRVFCGGNLAPGRPLSTALLMPRQDFYVAEVSSFQLERSRWLAPKVAVILNISSDHLNRHSDLRQYAECKFRILKRQKASDYAVLNRDDPLVYAARMRGRSRKVFFSLRHRRAEACVKDGYLWFEDQRVLSEGQVRLPGRHNTANCLAAIAAARLLGLGLAPIRRALREFAGLPHRLELVRRLHGVDYVNSSMTTNPAAGARTLAAVAQGLRRSQQPKTRTSRMGIRSHGTRDQRRGRRVVLIAGGREKGLPVQEYVRAIRRYAKAALLIGESRDRLAQELAAIGFSRYEVMPDLKAAVRAARERAEVGDTVLFAPGFASFDQFRDFAARGSAFREKVRNLG
ncbi:UDP-N-acetylmuramoyl-L-alanine--D-glutamate ligase, partial [candidate division WOR-3 bacterium]|nr:UDP-N-acetylmuramoyl-L-alanine--D-glutamate ligase [candidate division WOR-3 bacterium]